MAYISKLSVLLSSFLGQLILILCSDCHEYDASASMSTGFRGGSASSLWKTGWLLFICWTTELCNANWEMNLFNSFCLRNSCYIFPWIFLHHIWLPWFTMIMKIYESTQQTSSRTKFFSLHHPGMLCEKCCLGWVIMISRTISHLFISVLYMFEQLMT